MDLLDRKGISVGDWVVSSQMAGCWLVTDIRMSYFDRKENGYVLLLKKGFTAKMKFQNGTDWCHVFWCEKASPEKLEEIETLFRENPAKQRQFEQSGAMVKPAVQSWFLSCEDNLAEEFARKLESLPETFTQGKFFRFVHEIGLRKYMKDSAREIIYTLRIFCYPWEVDQNYNQLYFRPTIEDENGKAV